MAICKPTNFLSSRSVHVNLYGIDNKDPQGFCGSDLVAHTRCSLPGWISRWIETKRCRLYFDH